MKIFNFFIFVLFQIRFVLYQATREKNHKTVSGWNLIFDLSHLKLMHSYYDMNPAIYFNCVRGGFSIVIQFLKMHKHETLPTPSSQPCLCTLCRRTWEVDDEGKVENKLIDRNVIFGWFINSGPIIRILWRAIIMIAIIIGIRKFSFYHHPQSRQLPKFQNDDKNRNHNDAELKKMMKLVKNKSGYSLPTSCNLSISSCETPMPPTL